MTSTRAPIFAINAINSNSGGGRTIRDGLIAYLRDNTLPEQFVILAGKSAAIDLNESEALSIHRVPDSYTRGLLAPFVYGRALDRVLRKIGADAVLNLGDLVIETAIPQAYLFDWSYALDVHEKVWASMTWPDWVQRRYKLRLVRRAIHKPYAVIAQTEEIADQLRARYHLPRVGIIGNAVAETGLRQVPPFECELPDGIRLLCPSLYYPHKNLEILLDVAARAKAANKPYRFILTVAPSASRAAAAFVDAIASRGLGDYVFNVGQLPNTRMAGLYHRCHGMILPTLLESFTLVYVEAMQYRLPILTSDMWFAHGVCKDAAAYFAPFDAEHISSVIDGVYAPGGSAEELVRKGDARLASLPGWRENGESILEIMRETARRGQ